MIANRNSESSMPDGLADGRRVESICTDFETAWRKCRGPRIEDFLSVVADEIKGRLFAELLAVELELRFAEPSLPQLSEYIERFAQHAELVERTFRSVTFDWQADDGQIELPATSPQINRDDRHLELGDEIARGGMGVVYRCRDTALGRELALKTLLPQHQWKADAILRFENEAGITARLQHPGVPPVHEFGRLDDGRPFLTMRLVEGRTLAEILQQPGNEPSSERRRRLLEIVRDVCKTVAYAHDREVIHRDLKPSNMMVGAFGEVQVMDWGLAKELDTLSGRASRPDFETQSASDERTSQTPDAANCTSARGFRAGDTDGDPLLTLPGAILGTLSYMPPEQAGGASHGLDKRADVFSLGAMLCEILTGHPPYWRDEEFEKVGPPSEAVDSRSAAAGSRRGESADERLDLAHERLRACGADRELIRLACDCLQADLNQRPNDAVEVAARLDEHLQSVDERLQQAELQRATAETKAVEARKRARVLRLLVVLLAAGVAAAAVAVFAFQRLAGQREQARAAESLQRQAAQQAQGKAERAETTAARQRDAALAAEATASAARLDAEMALTDLYTQSGMSEAKLGDVRKAVLYFAAAARQARDDPHRRWANRTRVRTFSRGLPKPAALLNTDEQVDRITFHPAAPYVLTRTLREPRDVVWDLRTGQPVALPDQFGQVRAVAWSADGMRLAVGNVRGEFFVSEYRWESSPQSPFVPPELGDGVRFAERTAACPISLLTFDATGHYLAIAAGSFVRVWDVEQQDWHTPAWQHPAEIQHIQFNEARRELITCAADDQFRVYELNGQANEPVLIGTHVCGRRGTTFLRPALSGDGNALLTAEAGLEIVFWDLASRAERCRRHSPSTYPYAFRVSRDGKLIGIAGQIGISAVNFEGDVVMPYRARRYMFSCDFTRDSRLLSGGEDRQAEIWSPDQAAERIGVAAVNSSDVCALEASADGHWLATAEKQGPVRVWRLATERTRHVQIPTITQYCFAHFTPDGRHLMATARIASEGVPKKGTNAFATATGEPAGQELRTERLPYCAFSPDGTHVVTVAWGGDDESAAGKAAVWDWRTGEVLQTADVAPAPVVCAFSPDGNRLAVLSRDGSLNVLDVASGAITAQWQSGYRHVGTAARSPLLAWADNGRTLLCFQGTDAVVAWDVQRQTPRFQPFRHDGMCTQARLSADSTTLATGGNDALVKLWNLKTGALLTAPLKHPAPIYSLAFSRDGRWLATGCRDFHARVWSTKTGELSGPAIASRDAPHVGWAAGSRALLVGTHYFGQFNAYDWRIGQPLQPQQVYLGLDSIDTDSRARFAALGMYQRYMELLDLDDLLDDQQLAVAPQPNEHRDSHREFLERLSDDDLVIYAELMSNQRMNVGGVTSNMTNDEWRQRWDSFRCDK